MYLGLKVNIEFSNSLSFVENENIWSLVVMITFLLLKLTVQLLLELVFLKTNSNGNDSFVKTSLFFHLFCLKYL